MTPPRKVHVARTTPDGTHELAPSPDPADVEYLEYSDQDTGAWRADLERQLEQARIELEAGRDLWRDALKLQVEEERSARKLADGAFEEALELQLGAEEPRAPAERRRVQIERRAAAESPSRAERPRVLRLRTTNESDSDMELRGRVEALERAARDRGWQSRGGDRSLEQRVTELERFMETKGDSSGARRSTEDSARNPAIERGPVRVLVPSEDGRGLVELEQRRLESASPRAARPSDSPEAPEAPEARAAPRARVAPRAPVTPWTRVFRAESPSAGDALPRASLSDARDRAEIESMLQELRGEAERLRAELQRMRGEIERLPAAGSR